MYVKKGNGFVYGSFFSLGYPRVRKLINICCGSHVCWRAAAAAWRRGARAAAATGGARARPRAPRRCPRARAARARPPRRTSRRAARPRKAWETVATWLTILKRHTDTYQIYLGNTLDNITCRPFEDLLYRV